MQTIIQQIEQFKETAKRLVGENPGLKECRFEIKDIELDEFMPLWERLRERDGHLISDCSAKILFVACYELCTIAFLPSSEYEPA